MRTPPPARDLLAGKRAVVTAAAGTGIGSAVAERCLLEGAQVLISDIHERRLDETADRLAEATGTRPHTALCNVTVEDDVQGLVGAAVDAMGGIDVMMNNAGLGGQVKLVDMTDEQWSSVLTVTLDGTMRCTRAVMRHMIEAGIEG
ncbi:MAG: SDR family NAD(P)-dependent oxidoreductase, partial [Actinomycetota bacterium]